MELVFIRPPPTTKGGARDFDGCAFEKSDDSGLMLLNIFIIRRAALIPHLLISARTIISEARGVSCSQRPEKT